MANRERITPDYIFEASWEVCNKLGGIYTVLSTKAKTLQDRFPDRIIFIGPDLWQGIDNPDFIEDDAILKEWKKQASEKEKLKIRTGRWNVPGKPVVVLADFQAYFKVKDGFYFRMWEKFGVDSLHAYGDYDESCMFAYSAGLVIESLYNYLKLNDKKVVAHLNEWMLGMALLYLKDRLPSIATVFTTHATSIGRSICGNNKPLYAYFDSYNGDLMAKELNMEAKHSIEKQAAFYADCFTTVSELTAKECGLLLEKQPDIVTPNGFESNFVPKEKEFDKKRKAARQMLIQVAEALTGSQIDENAFLLATCGRYEYKNKGIDIFIEALNRVCKERPNKQIIAYILSPAHISGAREDLQNRLKANEKKELPLVNPFYTHNLCYPEHDKVCGYLNYLNFMNQDNIDVKIIFVPSYLNGDDGIFDLSYYDLLIGLDLTVFPSYYEPWGYTPLESVAFSIPTVTTNLAGFGLWAKNEIENNSNFSDSVEIIERTDDNYFEAAELIKESILKYATEMDSKQIRKAKNAAQLLSREASWTYFIEYCLDAYNIALSKK
ncbi:MAG: glycogen/starch synthase [Dysgonamonadaceae bacterium]|jgi:glycosyltransferase involved in cell wall biosynthesis|nr:glycogen/starch synthase [Dysgonamonadaceae bacterium]